MPAAEAEGGPAAEGGCIRSLRVSGLLLFRGLSEQGSIALLKRLDVDMKYYIGIGPRGIFSDKHHSWTPIIVHQRASIAMVPVIYGYSKLPNVPSGIFIREMRR